MTGLRLTRQVGADELLAVAGEFLEAREAEHNLLLGILPRLRTGSPDDDPVERPYLCVVQLGDLVVAVALWTPPWNLVLSEIDDPGALPVIAGDVAAELAERGPSATIRGVLGPSHEAEALARLWASRTGASVRLATRERIFRLQEVRRPRPVPGSMRLATRADRMLLVAWLHAFNEEALDGDSPADMTELAHRMVTGEGRAAYLWDDDGPASLAAIAGRTPHGARVGPVYTPPERRGRGYASNLVAAVSQAELDAGGQAVFLFTNLANPTANHIYQTIGYQAVRDVADWRFEPVSQPPRAPAPAGS